MTDNEIIATALGWKVDAEGYWVSPIRSVFDAWKSKTPPQYDANHNLIHSAEDALTEEECMVYLDTMSEIIKHDHKVSSAYKYEWYLRHATAAQCAPAMAKVLGQRDPK